MLKKAHYRTIVISDLHPGTENSKVKEVMRFLWTNTCDTLPGWLSVQIIMIRAFYTPLHIPYYLIGLGLIATGYFL